MLLLLFLLGGESIAPHVTFQGSLFSTDLVARSSSEVTETIDFTAYNASGSAIASRTLTLGPNREFRQDAHFFFGREISHFTAEHESGVHVGVGYTAGGSPAFVANNERHGRVWTLDPGDASLVFDAFAVVNVGTASASVTVRQRSISNGAVLDQDTVSSSLRRMAKALYVINNSFANRSDAYYEISSSQPISVMALMGDHGNEYFWSNPAKPYLGRDYDMTSRLAGFWVAQYIIQSTLDTVWAFLPDPIYSPTANFDYIIIGVDEFGNPDVIGAWSHSSDQFAVVDASDFGDDAYTFTIDGDQISGCHYTVFSDGTLSGCHTMAGLKVDFNDLFSKRNKGAGKEAGPPSRTEADGAAPPEIQAVYRALKAELLERKEAATAIDSQRN